MHIYTELEMLRALHKLAMESSGTGTLLNHYLMKAISSCSNAPNSGSTSIQTQITLSVVTKAAKCAGEYKELMEWAREAGYEDFMWRTIRKYLN